MPQAVLSKQESTLSSYEDTMNQSSSTGSFHVEAPEVAGSNMLNSATVWGLSLLVVLLIARVFGRKNKLPTGAKQLPRLPGKFRIPSTTLQLLTVFRDTMDR